MTKSSPSSEIFSKVANAACNSWRFVSVANDRVKSSRQASNRIALLPAGIFSRIFWSTMTSGTRRTPVACPDCNRTPGGVWTSSWPMCEVTPEKLNLGTCQS
ncbi:MAG: hypothetical protein Ct9H300mP1_00630 [Planctomycetaceae bacterium]|nr:MAG: hypothetical protein Ct9H300mP1_00630 [Planctomycetaceae bacterium]